MLENWIRRSVNINLNFHVWVLLTKSLDLEDVGQQLIEDNIVAVSRQMIDKEASVPKSHVDGSAHQSGEMDIGEEL